MQDIFETYGTDRDAEVKGARVKADLLPEAVFFVARAGGANEEFAKEGEKRFRPHRREIESGKLPQEKASRLLIELFIDTQLKGWEGVNVRKRNEDGSPAFEEKFNDQTGEIEKVPVFEPLEFTRENALKVFTRLPDLHLELQRKAQAITTFQNRDITDADAKN